MSERRRQPGAAGPTAANLTIHSEALAHRVLIFCVVAEILFVFLDYHINFGEWTAIGAMRRMFNIAREDSLASWFATTQTLMTGLTLGLIYLAARRQPGMGWKATGWLVLASFFVYMAVDDGAQLHERLGSTFEAMREDAGASLDFFPSYTWQLIFLPFFGGLGLFMLVFLWRELGSPSSRALLLTAISFQVFAVGLDFLEGLEPNHPWNLYAAISDRYALETWTEWRFGESAYDTLDHFSRSIEEALEMAAISILWFLFLRHLSIVPGHLNIRFSNGATKGGP
ncbi:MAG TPA: hypothetical protein VGC53_14345 [Vicinamibacteria bacterium]